VERAFRSMIFGASMRIDTGDRCPR